VGDGVLASAEGAALAGGEVGRAGELVGRGEGAELGDAARGDLLALALAPARGADRDGEDGEDGDRDDEGPEGEGADHQ
jgi:hypothetical protein